MPRFYNDFTYSDSSTGPSWPFGDHLAEAIGSSSVSFASLEDDLSGAITFLLKRGEEVGRIVTAELSFKNKVHLLGSLFKQVATSNSANLPRLRELLGLCLKIESVRNQVIHSSWVRDAERTHTIRRKFTAKMHRGFHEDSERLTPEQLQDISVYCGYLSWCLDELLFNEFGTQYGEP